MKAAWLLLALLILLEVINPSESFLFRKKKRKSKPKPKAKTKAKAKPKPRIVYTCPKSYLYRDKHCYRISTDSKTFLDAEKACAAQGGHLASIRSWNELKYLSDRMGKIKLKKKRRWARQKYLSRAWVGLLIDESSKKSKWFWTDGYKSGYKPKLYGSLGRSWTKSWTKFTVYLKLGKAPKNAKLETAVLFRWLPTAPRVRPELPTKKRRYICKQLASTCHHGWTDWNKNCYRFYPKPALSFEAAERYCNKVKGQLTSIHNDAEYNMLMSLLKVKKGTNEGWVGVMINHGHQTWKWTDGSKADYLPKKSKLDEKPKGADVARLIYHDGKEIGLYDTLRSKKFGFVCKVNLKKPYIMTTTTTTTTARTFTK